VLVNTLSVYYERLCEEISRGLTSYTTARDSLTVELLNTAAPNASHIVRRGAFAAIPMRAATAGLTNAKGPKLPRRLGLWVRIYRKYELLVGAKELLASTPIAVSYSNSS